MAFRVIHSSGHRTEFGVDDIYEFLFGGVLAVHYADRQSGLSTTLPISGTKCLRRLATGREQPVARISWRVDARRVTSRILQVVLGSPRAP